jgi:KDO2-lipid IV(A) lauroyltransferase
MTKLLDTLYFSLFLVAITIVRCVPMRIAVPIGATLFRLFFMIVPRCSKTSKTNLALVFPGDAARQEEIYQRSFLELSRSLLDSVRAAHVSDSWITSHITFAGNARTTDEQSEKKVGTIVVTGHLGSFELLGQALALQRKGVFVVMRSLGSSLINNWWIKMREKRGNRCINRIGALRGILKGINSGRDVVILVDQNIKRQNAVFVEWFGKSAATTPAVALVALSTGCAIEVSSIRHLSDDSYELFTEPCPIDDIRNDDTLDREAKVLRITQRLSTQFAQRILAHPEAWLWMHRRWKTATRDEDETFYKMPQNHEA